MSTQRIIKAFRIGTAAVALLCGMPVAAQSNVLLKEAVSREITLHVGAFQVPQVRTVVSLEVSLHNGGAAEHVIPQPLSRELTLAVTTTAPPARISGLAVTLSPDGSVALLDWSVYDDLAQHDIAEYRIFLEDHPFTSVTDLTPYLVIQLPAGVRTLELSGLPAWQDHYLAVVPVDLLGGFDPTVEYAAGYIQGAELISREVALHRGGLSEPLGELLSREYHLTARTAATPARIENLLVTSTPLGDRVTLNWESYNELNQHDIAEYRVYSADHPFTTVDSMSPDLVLPPGSTSVEIGGLTPWRDRTFAVVPVDLDGQFDAMVTYAANYVLSQDLSSRELSLHNGGLDQDRAAQLISREVGLIAPDSHVPAPVTGLTSGFTAETSTSAYRAVDLAWPQYDELAQTDVVAYRIYVGTAYFADVSAMQPYQVIDAGISGCTVSGLESNTIYYLAAVAEDAGGRFDPTVRSVSALSSPGGVSAVQDLQVQSGPDFLLYSWNPPAEGVGFLKHYEVTFGGEPPVILPANAQSYRAEGLAPAHGYPFQLLAVDIFGNPAGSSSRFAATWLANPTLAKKELDGAVRLTWEPVTADHLLQHYAIYRDGADFSDTTGLSPLLTTTQRQITITGLTNFETSFFAVVAVNISAGFDPLVSALAAVPQPDIRGARIIAAAAAGPGATGATTVEQAFQALSLTFDDVMDAASFTPGDVSITSPLGEPVPVLGVSPLAEDAFLVTLADSVTAGTYQVIIGPEILDEAGNSMDQNDNGINGEIDDHFELHITLSNPGFPVGNGDGLLGEYVATTNLQGTSWRQRDPTVEMDWNTGAPTENLPADGFSVSWSGELEVRFEADYIFRLLVDDGARLWLDDVLLIDGWNDSGADLLSLPVPLLRGRHAVRLDFVEHTGTAEITWQWSCPFFPMQTVPQAQLYSGLAHALFVDTPAVLPDGGIVTAASDIVLTCETEDATIYYSFAAADPEQPETWSVYVPESPIRLQSDATLRTFAAAPERNRSGVRISIFQLQYTELAGTIWMDADGNGIQDAGEAPAGNRFLYLDVDDNQQWSPGEASARSNAGGAFSLRTPLGGTHRLRLALAPGERLSRPVEPLAGYDVPTIAGQRVDGLDFGLLDTLPPTATFDQVLAATLPTHFSGSIDDPTAVIQVVLNGITLTANHVGDGTWQLAAAGFGNLVEGCHDVDLIATDPAGNTQTSHLAAAVCLSLSPPAVVSVAPLLLEGRPLARAEIAFDRPLDPDSLQPADITLTHQGRGAAVTASLVRLEAGATRIVAQFPAQLTNGDYRLTVGPDIDDVYGNRMSASHQETLTLRLPDLAVSDVVVAPATLEPGATVSITWNEGNLGLLTGTAPGNTTFTLLTDPPDSGGDIALGSVGAAGPLPPGQDVPREHSLQLPDWLPAGDTLTLRVEANASRSMLEADWSNNRSQSPPLQVEPALFLRLAAATIAENGGSLRADVRRNGDLSNPLDVSLTLTQGSGLLHPPTVQIPAGQSVIGFDLTPVNDTVVSGDRTVTLTASAANARPGEASLSIREDDYVSLSLQALGDTDILEGDAREIRLTRDQAAGLDAPLTVTLSLSVLHQLLLPATVTIPAGETGVTFLATTIDDDEYEQTGTVLLWGSAPQCRDADLSLTIHDDDEPVLSVQLERTSCSEGDGPQAITGMLSRGDRAGADLRVQLEVDDPASLTVPSTVLIPAGRSQVAFTIGARDNDLLDGERTVRLTLAALRSDCGCPGTSRNTTPRMSTLQVDITVRDDDAPGLALSADRDTVREGIADAVTFTIRRNTPPDDTLVVTLSAEPEGELALPATVIIPAGDAAVQVTADSISDGIQDGTKTVLVRAAAPGLTQAELPVRVTDLQLPDLVISAVSADARVMSGNTFAIHYTLLNQGEGNAESDGGAEGSGWLQRVYLSSDPFIGDDTPVGEYRMTTPLPAGEEWAVSFSVSTYAPPVNGQYWLVVVADVADDVAEIVETNNARISAQPIEVSASYEAQVQTDFESGLTPRTLADVTPIVFYGSATRLGDGLPAPSVPVHVHVQVGEFARVLLAVTDSNGQFTTLFRPLPGEGGAYTIGAAHPGDSSAPPQDSFLILGMRATPAAADIVLPVGEIVPLAFSIRNLAPAPLTGLHVSLPGAPPTLSLNATLSTTTLDGLGELTLTCEFEADDPGEVQTLNLALHLEADGGVTLDIPLALTITPLKAVLKPAPTQVYAGMPRGTQTLVQVMLGNQGAVHSGPIAITLPAADWLTLATDNPMPGIPPGGQAALVFCLTPEQTADLARYEGHVVISPEQGDDLTLPFEFRVISDATGDLEVTTANQFYYYAEGAPTLPGAQVQILDGFSGDLVAEAESNDQGSATFANLQEGYYTVVGSADKHRPHRELVFVAAGRTTKHLAYMVRNTVEITWTVEPVELEDRVKINIETTFETNVPAPVVVVDPPIIDLGDLKTVGQVERITMTISNHGLISARGLTLNVGTHPYYSIEPLITEFGDLPARGSVTLPVVLRRIGDASTIGARGVACGVPISVQFELCRRLEAVPVGTANSDGDCGGGGDWHPQGGGGSGGGRISGSGGGGSRDVICACIIEADCPCVLPYLKAGLSCVISFIPGHDLPKCFYNGYNCGGDILALNIGVTSLTGCAGAALDCAAAAGRAVPGLGQVLGGVNCLSGIYDAIRECNPSRFTSPQGVYGNVLLLLQAAQAHYLYALELYGDARWLDYTAAERRTWESHLLTAIADTSDEGFRISTSEEAGLLALAAGPAISDTDKQTLIERINNTETYLQNGWAAEAAVPAELSRNFIDMTALVEWNRQMNEARDLALSLGYDGYLAAVKGELARINSLFETLAMAKGGGRDRIDGSGECARVKLLLSQDVVLAREGFEATLKIENGDNLVLSELGAEVRLFDENGNDAAHLLAVGAPELTQFTGIDGSGVLGPGKTGTARWVIVPRAEAAPAVETTYFVGGMLTYAIEGRAVTIPLAPVRITVHPQPELHLEYYHQRDVFSDDPWTTQIEPSIPYELAVVVRNTGAGMARNLQIISGQPQIVENEKGLLIDFQLIGHQIDGQSMTPALTAVFGDLAPGGSTLARWWMTATLQGQFTEYAATLSHVSPLGDPRLSQIRSVSIFELIRSVRVNGSHAFLTNDQLDAFDMPDSIHLLNGEVLPVREVDETQAVVNGSIQPGHWTVTLTTPSGEGWNYLRLVDRDPGGGQYVLVDVQRSGRQSLPPENAWQTDRTFLFGGVRPVLENNLHLLFQGTAGHNQESFTLAYRSADQVGPAVRGLRLPEDAVLSETQDVVLAEVSEPVAPASVAAAALLLQRDGVTVPLPPLTAAMTGATTLRLSGLAAANNQPGSYRLTLDGSGITDLFDNPGSGSAEVQWTVFPGGPVPLDLTIVGSPRQNFPIDACTITFSRDVEPTSVQSANLRLYHDEMEIGVGSLTIEAIDSRTLRLADLAPANAAPGAYRLVFTADGITGPGGEPGFGTADTGWTLDLTAPQVEAIIPLPTAFYSSDQPAAGALDAIRIVFSEPLAPASFSLADVHLTRDGTGVPLPPETALSSADTRTFLLQPLHSLTIPEGAYVLQVAQSGVQDEAGNAGSGNAELTWICDRNAPQPPANLRIVPDTGQADDDGITAATSFTLSGDLDEDGLLVTLLLDDGRSLPASVTGTTFSVELANLDSGNHPLTVIAADAAGNQSRNEWDIFVDAIDLTAAISIGAIPPDGTLTLEVTFADPIAPDTLTIDDLSLFADGHPLPLPAATTIVPLPGDGRRFDITGLTISPDAAIGELHLLLAGVEKLYSGRNGSGSARVTWENQGAIENLDLTPRSPLVPETILAPTRTPTLSGNTPLDWLDIRVDDPLDGPLARGEITGGDIALPLQLLRDGEHTLTIRGLTAAGAEVLRELTFLVDSQPPEIREIVATRSPVGDVNALLIRFSEPVNLQPSIDDDSIRDMITLQGSGERNEMSIQPDPGDLNWNSAEALLTWTPQNAATWPTGTYTVQIAAAGITDFAEHPLRAPETSRNIVVARAHIVDGTPTTLDALGPGYLTYRWDFGDGSAPVEGSGVTHTFAENGEFEIWMTVLDQDTPLFRYVSVLSRGSGNQPPVLDLDLLRPGNHALARICPQEQVVPLVSLPRLLLQDSDDRYLDKVSIHLLNPEDGDLEGLLAPSSLPPGVSAVFTARTTNLTLLGPATPETFRHLLAEVRYRNETPVPAAQDRLLTVIADDGSAQSEQSIILQTRDRMALTVHPGWNLYALPFTPEDPSAEAVFADERQMLVQPGPVFRWDPQYRGYTLVENLVGQGGIWAFSEASNPAITRESTGFCERNTLDLAAGWNLWGPAEEISLAEAHLQDPRIGAAWEWLPARHTYRRLQDNDILRRGTGYWLWVDAPPR